MDSLSSYRISPKTGFFIEKPARELPGAFHLWLDLLQNAMPLIQQGRFGQKVHELPLLDTAVLETYEEKRFAHLVVALLTSCYIWKNGDCEAPSVLPKQLAIPLHYLSTELGLRPIACHADLALANTIFWKPFEMIENPMEDMSVILRLTGSKNWDAFFLITSLCEVKFTPALKHVFAAIKLSNEKNRTHELKKHLIALTPILTDVKLAMNKFHKYLDPKAFYNKIRPLLNGWQAGSQVFPNGLIYEGVSDKPIYCNGSSAAQSLIFQIMDYLLGIEHNEKQQQFLSQMRTYMLKEHQQFLLDIEEHSKVRRTVNESRDPELTKAFNDLILAVEEFRSYHIAIVTKFIIIPSKVEVNEYQSLQGKGTGGQDLIKFLKNVRDSTKSSKMDIVKNGKTHRK